MIIIIFNCDTATGKQTLIQLITFIQHTLTRPTNQSSLTGSHAEIQPMGLHSSAQANTITVWQLKL